MLLLSLASPFRDLCFLQKCVVRTATLLQCRVSSVRWLIQWLNHTSCRQRIRESPLTPSLPQSVKNLGWKMQSHACQQYSFLSYSKPFSILCVLVEVLSHVNVKKKKKMHKNFKFLNFYLSFSSDILAVKGLNVFRGLRCLGVRQKIESLGDNTWRRNEDTE